jgi:ribosomal protein S18 acetylase RimI-like enzyme
MLPNLEKLSVCAFTDLYDPPWKIQDFQQIFDKGGYGWAAINDKCFDKVQYMPIMSEAVPLSQEPDVYMGYILLQDCLDFVDILKVATHPNFQRQGIASQLLQTALEHSQKRFVLEVSENNYKAIALYQRYGFRCIGRRKGYYKSCKLVSPCDVPKAVDAITLEKN